MAREKCRIHVSGSTGAGVDFSLSRDGWTGARERVYAIRDTRGAAYATLICHGSSIPLYRCDKGKSCAIEGSSGSTALAGTRRRKRSR